MDVKIDKTVPSISVTGADKTELTCGDVNVGLSMTSGISKGEVKVLKDGAVIDSLAIGAGSYVVSENGLYTFRLTNGAGVTAEASVDITNIDKKIPRLLVETNGYHSDSWVDSDIRLTLKNTESNLGTNRFEYRIVPEESWIRCETKGDNTAEIQVTQDVNAVYEIRVISEAQDHDGAPLDPVQTGRCTLRIDKGQIEFEVEYQDVIATECAVTYHGTSGISGIRSLMIGKIGNQGQVIPYKVYDDFGENTTLLNGAETFTQNGTYLFTLKNGVGNQVSKTVVIEKIDRKAPVLTVNTNGYEEGTWVKDDVVFTLGNRTSNLGRTSYYVKAGDGEWTLIETTDSGTSYTVGESIDQTYQFKAVSEAGVEGGEIKSCHVRLDKTAPVIQAVGDTVTYSREQTIHGEVTVGISGIKKVEVRKLGEQYQDITKSYKDGYKITENGSYQFRLTNNLNIPIVVESNVMLYENIDRKLPVMRLTTSGYKGDRWSSRDVTITLANTNAKNLGTSRYFYGVADGLRTDWTEFGGTLVIREDTNAEMAFKVQSAAGTDSNIKILTIKVDKTEPEQLQIAVGEEDLREFRPTNKIFKSYKEKVKVTFQAVDDMSGVDYFTYMVNDGKESRIVRADAKEVGGGTYQAEVYIEPQFIGQISVAAYNHVKLHYPVNGRKEDMKLVVDALPPTAPVLDTHGYTPGQWTKDDISLSLKGSYALSGVKRYEYTKTSGEMPAEGAVWTELPAASITKADAIKPNQATGAQLDLNTDCNETYFFRGVSQAELPGELTRCDIRLQKTVPDGAVIKYPEIGEDMWYKTAPQITLLEPQTTPAPKTIYYKIWCTTRGEQEETAAETAYNGSNPPEFPTDGEYGLRFWVVDGAGNRNAPENDVVRQIRLDGTAPRITISYDGMTAMNGSYFNKERRVFVTVDEMNFDSQLAHVTVEASNGGSTVPGMGAWVTDGTKHTASLLFLAEADYKLRVTCTDKAGNEASVPEVQEFTVDKTAPDLELNGVVNLTANRDPVTPEIVFKDLNVDLNRSKFTLTGVNSGNIPIKKAPELKNGAYHLSVGPIDQDDNYVLSAAVYDKAGNQAEDEVTFSVNQHGATFVFEQAQYQNTYTNQPFTPSIQVWDVDEVTIVSMTVNGKEADYTFLDGVLKLNRELTTDGKYVLTLDVTDAAGNAASMKPVEFYLDTTRPVNHILGVEEGKYYFEDVTVTVKTENPQDTIQEIKLDGKVLGPSEYTALEGGAVSFTVSGYQSHTVEVKSVDEAGNVSDPDPVHFTLSNSLVTKIFYKGKETVKSLLDGIFH